MPGGVTNTSSHPILLWPGIFDTWGQTYDEHAPEYTQLWDVRDSKQAYEKLVEITGHGLAELKSEGGPGTYDSEIQGVVTNIQPIPYSLGWQVTFEELEDNLYAEVAERRVRANAFSINQTVETIAAFPYNNAFSSTYFTTGDGQPMCSASHVNPVGGTFSNLGPASDICEAAIEDVQIQIMNATTSRGLHFQMMGESLITSTAEFYNTGRILKSVLQAETSNNSINVLKATGAFPKGVVANHYMTSPHAWFVRTNCPSGMYFFWRTKPRMFKDNDHQTLNALALTYFRCSVGVGDPRAIFGCNGP
jgi:hypothetical protein